jgi:hypothetical protein
MMTEDTGDKLNVSALLVSDKKIMCPIPRSAAVRLVPRALPGHSSVLSLPSVVNTQIFNGTLGSGRKGYIPPWHSTHHHYSALPANNEQQNNHTIKDIQEETSGR